MRIPIDPTFQQQIRTRVLRFTCSDCTFHVNGHCAHEWPDHDHRMPPEPDATHVVFCKEFELA